VHVSALQNVIRWFIPDESRFFDYVVAVAETADRAAILFHGISRAETPAAREAILVDLREVEHDGDRALRTLSEALDATYVTPIDREDLYHLASALETISDFIAATANHLAVHRMETLPEGTRELADILVEATKRCVHACTLLRQGYKADEIRAACQQLKKLEQDADVTFRTRIGELFSNEKDAIVLIKHKEFLEGLEEAVDRCADVATVLEAILIKNG
jgi:uncharacterized protein Yka (UPF0111/DUF47 family)